jgi:hypothetical protein
MEWLTFFVAWEWLLCLIYTSVYQARKPFGMYIVFIFGTLHLVALFMKQYTQNTNPLRARLAIYLLSFLLITTPFTFILRSMVYIIELINRAPSTNPSTIPSAMVVFGDDDKDVPMAAIIMEPLPVVTWLKKYSLMTPFYVLLFVASSILLFVSLLFIELGYLITYGLLMILLLIILFEKTPQWAVTAFSEVVMFWLIVFPLRVSNKHNESIPFFVMSFLPKLIMLIVENYQHIEQHKRAVELTWTDHLLFSFHRILLTTMIGTFMILGSYGLYLALVIGATESELAIHRAFNYVF